MSKLEMTTRVGADGTLTIPVPAAVAAVDVEVHVTVEAVTGANGATRKPFTDRAAWIDFIRRTAGSWRGSLERPEQGELQEREQWA